MLAALPPVQPVSLCRLLTADRAASSFEGHGPGCLRTRAVSLLLARWRA